MHPPFGCDRLDQLHLHVLLPGLDAVGVGADRQAVEAEPGVHPVAADLGLDGQDQGLAERVMLLDQDQVAV